MNGLSPHILARICPHRGLGAENTVSGVLAACSEQPYMVEFDLHLDPDGGLRLGHGLEGVRSADTDFDRLLEEAGPSANGTLLKVDLKLRGTVDVANALRELTDRFDRGREFRFLLNIGGLYGDDYATALRYTAPFIESRDNVVGLNMDPKNFRGSCFRHGRAVLAELGVTVHSVSPEIHCSRGGRRTLAFLKGTPVRHIHFWSLSPPSFPYARVHVNTLARAYERCTRAGYEVYFDIHGDTIVDRHNTYTALMPWIGPLFARATWEWEWLVQRVRNLAGRLRGERQPTAPIHPRGIA